MRRQELGIEHTVAAVPQPRDQMHEGDLARIGDAAEHALAEKGAAERDTVEPADQFALVPALDAVRRAAVEEAGVELQDLVIDPGIGPLVARFGAAGHHSFKCGGAAGRGQVLPNGSALPGRRVRPWQLYVAGPCRSY